MEKQETGKLHKFQANVISKLRLFIYSQLLQLVVTFGLKHTTLESLLREESVVLWIINEPVGLVTNNYWEKEKCVQPTCCVFVSV